MSDREGFERGPRVFIFRNELGLRWASSEMIGCRGRFLGMVSCTECREQGKSVGGGSVWTRLGQVQRVSGKKDAWHGRYGAWQCRARVPWCRGLGAVSARAQSETGRGTGAWECGAWSGCSGQLGRVSSACLGCIARSASVRSNSGN
jgi:hypothetical protein